MMGGGDIFYETFFQYHCKIIVMISNINYDIYTLISHFFILLKFKYFIPVYYKKIRTNVRVVFFFLNYIYI